MDQENTLRLLFPQVDARLIKATVLDGDDINSALDFLIEEGMQPDELKLEKACGLASNNVHVDGTLLMHAAKRHLVIPKRDELYSTDSSHDKHEESIVWKGGLVTPKPEDPCPNEGRELADFYKSDSQKEQATMQGNERIEWWAATWPNASGPRGDDVLDSPSSVQTDLEVEEEGSSSLWSDTELYNSIPQKVNWQQPIIKIDCSSIDSAQSSLLEKENGSSWGNVSDSMKFHDGCKSLVELDLPLSQDSFEVFSPMGLDANMSEQGGPVRRHTQLSKGHANDDDRKLSLCLSVNTRRDCAIQEGLLETSRYIIDTEDLDKLVVEAKCQKENVRKGMEDIYLLRQQTEQEESAAQQAKAEATRGGADILLKVADMRKQMLRERAEYDLRAAEVYGERSVLSMEARELRSRLLETQAEQERAMSLLDCVRCTLTERLQKAAQEKNSAIEEAKMKEECAKELLAQEEGCARTLVEDFKALETEAETCRKLREFLIERGNIVDSLQGEMAVLSEDILNFKKQVDEGIPLSASRSLSWSHLSHLTEQFASTSPSIEVESCRPLRSLALESSDLIKSLSSTSILTLSSGTSGLLVSVGPIDCALRSQYFSPNLSPINVANEKGVVDSTLDEKVEGLSITCISCDDDYGQNQQMKSNQVSSGVPVVEEGGVH
ncbi:hypothetical protein GOP47_0014565 [Adiantum capillus-veneris]|uniref:CUE domain-containing protein n=1 Tax=Adiantum capillus-veneris TaxID=13818 RepID=A0A9D4ZDL9_ADICA|nr:hypothetical protein GOP47_0014565 [Adiantum capillus-veneris]